MKRTKWMIQVQYKVAGETCIKRYKPTKKIQAKFIQAIWGTKEGPSYNTDVSRAHTLLKERDCAYINTCTTAGTALV